MLSIAFKEDKNLKWPQVGYALDFAGLLLAVNLNPRGLYFDVDMAPTSSVRRLASWPRWAVEFGLGEKRLQFKGASLIETLNDWKHRHYGRANLLMVLDELIESIEMPSSIHRRLRPRSRKK